MEVIDLTRQMMFNPGNAVKYIARAGLKDPSKEVQDLEKAVWYIQDELKRLTGLEAPCHRYGKLPVILSCQMNANRGAAVKLICLGTVRDLTDALVYLRREISELNVRARETQNPKL